MSITCDWHYFHVSKQKKNDVIFQSFDLDCNLTVRKRTLNFIRTQGHLIFESGAGDQTL
jgi:hypothetical protein